MAEPLTDEEIRRDRERVISTNQFGRVLNMFMGNPDMQEIEFYCPEPGTVLDDGRVFVESPGVNPTAMRHAIYDAALRGHWLKRELWVHKPRGSRSTWVYKYDPKAVKK